MFRWNSLTSEILAGKDVDAHVDKITQLLILPSTGLTSCATWLLTLLRCWVVQPTLGAVFANSFILEAVDEGLATIHIRISTVGLWRTECWKNVQKRAVEHLVNWKDYHDSTRTVVQHMGSTTYLYPLFRQSALLQLIIYNKSIKIINNNHQHLHRATGSI